MMRRIQMCIEEEVDDALASEAARQGVSKAALIRELVRSAARSSPRVEVAPVDATLVGQAWAWLRPHDERVYSFVDATSFALMTHRRIREALTFDGDFAAAGFVEVREP